MARCGKHQYGRALDVAKNATWWKKLEHTVQLLQPICDNIHKLEADSALLSQVQPIWTAVIQHTKEWASQLSSSCSQLSQRVVASIKERAEKSHNAAYLLDPCNFTTELADKDSLPRPPMAALTPQQRAAVNSLIARISKGSVQDVETEMQELGMGDSWPAEMAAVARKQASAGAGEVPIAMCRMFWLRKGFSTVPLTATAAAKLLSMHATKLLQRETGALGGAITPPSAATSAWRGQNS